VKDPGSAAGSPPNCAGHLP